MHKAELDRLLEKTLADALGVRMPTHRRAQPDKAKHHAKAPRRHKQMLRELHPAELDFLAASSRFLPA